MKIRILWLGKTRNVSLAALCQDYMERIRRLNPCELRVLKESPGRVRRGLLPEEEQLLLDSIAQSPCSILLDVGGRQLDSADFLAEIVKQRDGGTRQMDFLLAGPWGWSDRVRAAADQRWTLSRLTMPHELARAVFLEQLYRALAKIQGIPYEK